MQCLSGMLAGAERSSELREVGVIESVRGQEGNAQRVAASPCLSSSDSVDIDALRLAQLVVQPVAEVKLVEVDRLPESERGQGGFGSTGA